KLYEDDTKPEESPLFQAESLALESNGLAGDLAFKDSSLDQILLLGEDEGFGFGDRALRRRGPYYGQWLNTLFPPLAAAPRPTKEPKSTWPEAARELAKSLLRTDQLAKLAGGIE